MSVSNSNLSRPKSKAYATTVAIQSDTAKYRTKYKELKRKVREIEHENDKLHLRTLKVKRNIQRMRLERAILYERLEAENAAISRNSHGFDGMPSRSASAHPQEAYRPRSHPSPSPGNDRYPSHGAVSQTQYQYEQGHPEAQPASYPHQSPAPFAQPHAHHPGLRAEQQFSPSESPERQKTHGAEPSAHGSSSSMKVTLKRSQGGDPGGNWS